MYKKGMNIISLDEDMTLFLLQIVAGTKYSIFPCYVQKLIL